MGSQVLILVRDHICSCYHGSTLTLVQRSNLIINESGDDGTIRLLSSPYRVGDAIVTARISLCTTSILTRPQPKLRYRLAHSSYSTRLQLVQAVSPQILHRISLLGDAQQRRLDLFLTRVHA